MGSKCSQQRTSSYKKNCILLHHDLQLEYGCIIRPFLSDRMPKSTRAIFGYIQKARSCGRAFDIGT